MPDDPSGTTGKSDLPSRPYHNEHGAFEMADRQIQACACETINSDHPDAAILRAWERRKAAFLRSIEIAEGSAPEHYACMEIVDAAEAVIQATIAATPRGVAAQAWTALWHHPSITDADQPQLVAVTEGNLQYFLELGSLLDWELRLHVAVLRSLVSMGA
jgi:hypothetical protein